MRRVGEFIVVLSVIAVRSMYMLYPCLVKTSCRLAKPVLFFLFIKKLFSFFFSFFFLNFIVRSTDAIILA